MRYIPEHDVYRDVIEKLKDILNVPYTQVAWRTRMPLVDTLGFASWDKPIVYIQRGEGFDLTCRILAHEFRHIWQQYDQKWGETLPNGDYLYNGVTYTAKEVDRSDPSLPWEIDCYEYENYFMRYHSRTISLCVPKYNRWKKT